MNENMLNILIEQKKYIEAFRIYTELKNQNMLSNPEGYSNLLVEVERIDPVLTMDRETREKKVKRLSNILNRIRSLKAIPRKQEALPIRPTTEEPNIAPLSQNLPKLSPSDTASINPTEQTPMTYKGDLFKIMEDFTRSSIDSVMNLICGNFSREILSKTPRAEKINILKGMLERIEIIKRQKNKEYV